jgi:hypothetical protein
MRRRVETRLGADADGFGALLASVRQGEVDPYSAALRILADGDALASLVREPAK